MKKLAFALGLAAATAFAAPLAASSATTDPGGIRQTREPEVETRTVDTRDGRTMTEGAMTATAPMSWRAEGRDRSGNVIYVRTATTTTAHLIREAARRDRLGRYRVIDRRVIQSANRRNDRYDDRAIATIETSLGPEQRPRQWKAQRPAQEQRKEQGQRQKVGKPFAFRPRTRDRPGLFCTLRYRGDAFLAT